MADFKDQETELIINHILETFEKKRDEKGLSNVDLGNYLGMTSQNVGDIFKKKIRLRLEVMLPLMKLLGIETFFVENQKSQAQTLLEFMIQNKDDLLNLSKGFLDMSKFIDGLLLEPKKENRERAETLQLRYTEDEKALIKSYAQEQNKPIAELLLEMIKKEREKNINL
jgi:hypothetical protein